MSLPHIILGMLRFGPRSGYELNKVLDNTISFFWDADISSIYRHLASMEESGWVEYETVVQQDSPNKKVYSLTAPGREELQRWLAEPGKYSGSHNPFLAQLHFSDAIPVEQQLNVLRIRLKDLQAALQELERRAEMHDLPVPMPADALRKGVGRHLFSLEYGIRRFQFEIEWTMGAIQVLENAPDDLDQEPRPALSRDRIVDERR